MAESIMLDNAKDFAVEVVGLCMKLRIEQKEYVLTKQLTKSGTSIGANIYESKYAQSKADLSQKCKLR